MHYIIKYGLESHLEYCKIEKANYISHLKGKIEYGLFVNPYDYELKVFELFKKHNGLTNTCTIFDVNV